MLPEGQGQAMDEGLYAADGTERVWIEDFHPGSSSTLSKHTADRHQRYRRTGTMAFPSSACGQTDRQHPAQEEQERIFRSARLQDNKLRINI